MSRKRHPLTIFKSCEKKRAYETEKVAGFAIAEITKNGGRLQKAYKCKYCSAWHTSTIRGKNGKASN